MSKSSRSLVVALMLLLALMLPPTVLAQKGKTLSKKDPTPRGVISFGLVYAVTTANNLISFDIATPGTLQSNVAITGLQAGENVLGIDFRPVFTKQLYALGSTSRLYTINLTTGAATVVGAQFTTLLNGGAFGFDFNPTVDRIRVTSDADQNLRLNPDTGTVTVDVNLNPGNPNVVGSAYTNNFAGATTTTLYDIDSNLDILAIQNPPNNGTLNTVGSLGLKTSDLE